MEALKTLRQASLGHFILASFSLSLPRLPFLALPLSLSLQWSSYIRTTVRKEKGLPVLAELLRSDVDKVVRAVAIALRNLAMDKRNKELIGADSLTLLSKTPEPSRAQPTGVFSMFLFLGGYGLRDLVGNLPCGQQHPARNLEGDTVVSILNTIHELITDNPENARALIQGHAVQKLVAINKSR